MFGLPTKSRTRLYYFRDGWTMFSRCDWYSNGRRRINAEVWIDNEEFRWGLLIGAAKVAGALQALTQEFGKPEEISDPSKDGGG